MISSQSDIPHTSLIAAIKADKPHWADQVLKAWDEEEFRVKEPFAIEKYWSGQQSINVFEVAGTAHPDYKGMSWIEFLQNGKRMRQNLLLQEQNPDYYLGEDVKQPTMSYIAIDDSGWHVNVDGDHRTCIARFMLYGMGRTMLHGVNVESYRTDHQALNAFLRLRAVAAAKQLPLIIDSVRKTISREDTAGWMRERYEIKIRIKDVLKGTTEEITPAQAEALAERVGQAKDGIFAMLGKMFCVKGRK